MNEQEKQAERERAKRELLALEEDLLQWRRDPVTKRVLAWVQRERENLKEGLAVGAFSHISDDPSADQRVIGQCKAYAALLALEPHSLLGETE